MANILLKNLKKISFLVVVLTNIGFFIHYTWMDSKINNVEESVLKIKALLSEKKSTD